MGAVAVAADSLGGMERALAMAVKYSKVREQFGKPIGAYQAVQHAAAEIVADLEPARSYGTRLTHKTRSPQMLRVVLRWLRHAFAKPTCATPTRRC